MYVRKSLTDQHFNSSRQETNKSTQHLHVGADSLNPSLAVFVPFDQPLSVSSQGSQPHACCDTLSKPRMGHVGQNTYCSGSAQGPRKAIGISTVNLHYWLPVSLLLWKPIIGNCHTTEQFMEVFRLCMPQWELPLTAVFHQPRSAYLFTQWDKSIRNLNKSSLKRHWDSHSRSASKNSFLSLSIFMAAFSQLLDCPVFISFHLLQERSCTCFVFHCSFEDMEVKTQLLWAECIPLCPSQPHQKSLPKLVPTPMVSTLSHQGNWHLH